MGSNQQRYGWPKKWTESKAGRSSAAGLSGQGTRVGPIDSINRPQKRKKRDLFRRGMGAGVGGGMARAATSLEEHAPSLVQTPADPAYEASAIMETMLRRETMRDRAAHHQGRRPRSSTARSRGRRLRGGRASTNDVAAARTDDALVLHLGAARVRSAARPLRHTRAVSRSTGRRGGRRRGTGRATLRATRACALWDTEGWLITIMYVQRRNLTYLASNHRCNWQKACPRHSI